MDLTLPQETINDAKADGVTMLTDAMRETLQAYPVGGICQFGKNITDPEQLAQFNADLQAASRTPLFIAVDEEGVEAAAFTVMAMSGAGAPPDELEEIDFTVDRPFLFVIMSSDNLPLFAGVVNRIEE